MISIGPEQFREARRQAGRARQDAIEAAELGFREIVRERYTANTAADDILTLSEMAELIAAFVSDIGKLHAQLDTARDVQTGHQIRPASFDPQDMAEAVMGALPLSAAAAGVVYAHGEG